VYKIEDYILVWSKTRDKLEVKVMKKCREGYVCQGGVCVKGDIYIQAMIQSK